MTQDMKAADLIGKTINVANSSNYYIVKSADGETLQTEMHMGERTMPCPMPMTLLRTMLDAGKYIVGEDAPAAAEPIAEDPNGEPDPEAVGEIVDVPKSEDAKVTDPTPAPPLDGRGAATAKTIDMKPTKPQSSEASPTTAQSSEASPTKPQGTPRPSKGKAASKREQSGTRSGSAEREQARPEVKGRGGVTPAKGKLTYVTYQTSKGKTQGRICGFSEGDAAYVNGQELHGSAYPVNGVLCLSFSKAFTPWAEQMCKALNEGKTIDELRTMLADYEAKRAADQAAWKAKREAWKQSHTEGAQPEVKAETKGGYSSEDVAEMLRKIMAGGAIPEDIKKAMAA